MPGMTCTRCKTAPIFLAYVEDKGCWMAFDTQPDDTAGHWMMTLRDGGRYTAKKLAYGPELSEAMHDAIRLYVPHATRCSAANR